jgi:hypothetical protein
LLIASPDKYNPLKNELGFVTGILVCVDVLTVGTLSFVLNGIRYTLKGCGVPITVGIMDLAGKDTPIPTVPSWA